MSPDVGKGSPTESYLGKLSFGREERLKGRSRIREVFSKGRQYYCNGAKLFVLRNNLPRNRICFTFTKSSSRNFGSAVARNRAKRLGREAFRLIKERFVDNQDGCYDLILLIFPESKMTLSGRMEQVSFLFKKAGLVGV